MLTSHKDHHCVIKLLFNTGADTQIKNNKGNKAIDIARQMSPPKALTVLERRKSCLLYRRKRYCVNFVLQINSCTGDEQFHVLKEPV